MESCILVIDSGIGGVSVLNAVMRQLPRACYIYYADNALHFNWTMSGFAFEIDGTDAYADFVITKNNNRNVYVNVYVDGVLVGGACLNPEEFYKIIKS